MAHAPVLSSDTVAVWRPAIETLPASKPPCHCLSAARWSEMREACLDRFGAEAQRLGWTAPELFGVHPETGTLRTD